ncbi:hypothetical protein V8G54_015252 [Vigna mungo]|uniref:Uncharacterized protein n=1 Tax=Vigna mungo TaxID=3915 RepID=A0AAQ3NJW6_VIGMU
MGTCDLVKTAGEQRTRSVLILRSPRTRPLQRNLHRLVIRRWRNVNRVGSKANTPIFTLLIQIIAQLRDIPNHGGSMLEFRSHGNEQHYSTCNSTPPHTTSFYIKDETLELFKNNNKFKHEKKLIKNQTPVRNSVYVKWREGTQEL